MCRVENRPSLRHRLLHSTSEEQEILYYPVKFIEDHWYKLRVYTVQVKHISPKTYRSCCTIIAQAIGISQIGNTQTTPVTKKNFESTTNQQLKKHTTEIQSGSKQLKKKQKNTIVNSDHCQLYSLISKESCH